MLPEAGKTVGAKEQAKDILLNFFVLGGCNYAAPIVDLSKM